MALTDTFIRHVKHSGAPTGDKHTDGQGLFFAGKGWRQVLAHEAVLFFSKPRQELSRGGTALSYADRLIIFANSLDAALRIAGHAMARMHQHQIARPAKVLDRVTIPISVRFSDTSLSRSSWSLSPDWR